MSDYKYERIRRAVRADFAENLPEGALLPDTEALCRRYAVSAITVKKALRLLAEEGWVRRIPGVGTRVCRPPLAEHAGRELRVLTIDRWTFTESVREIARRFERLVPGVRFRWEPVREADYVAAVRGGGHDLFLANVWGIREVLTTPELQSAWRPLTEVPGLLYEPERCFENILPHCCGPEGRQRVLPFLVSPLIMIYNRSYPHLSEARIPEAPDMEEFIGLMRELKRRGGGKYVFLFLYSLNRWLHFLKAAGCPVFSADGRRCLVDTPEGRAGCGLIRRIMVEEALGLPGEDFLDQRSDGLDFFRYGGFAALWGTYRAHRTPTRCSLHFTRIPHGRCAGGQLLIEGVAVAGECAHPELAGAFLNFMQFAENQQLLNAEGNGFSAFRAVGEAQVRRDAVEKPGFEVILDALTEAEPLIAAPRYPCCMALWRLLYPVFIGNVPVAEGCRYAAREVNRMLENGNMT